MFLCLCIQALEFGKKAEVLIQGLREQNTLRESIHSLLQHAEKHLEWDWPLTYTPKTKGPQYTAQQQSTLYGVHIQSMDIGRYWCIIKVRSHLQNFMDSKDPSSSSIVMNEAALPLKWT